MVQFRLSCQEKNGITDFEKYIMEFRGNMILFMFIILCYKNEKNKKYHISKFLHNDTMNNERSENEILLEKSNKFIARYIQEYLIPYIFLSGCLFIYFLHFQKIFFPTYGRKAYVQYSKMYMFSISKKVKIIIIKKLNNNKKISELIIKKRFDSLA